jgi:hypothetical protein
MPCCSCRRTSGRVQGVLLRGEKRSAEREELDSRRCDQPGAHAVHRTRRACLTAAWTTSSTSFPIRRAASSVVLASSSPSTSSIRDRPIHRPRTLTDRTPATDRAWTRQPLHTASGPASRRPHPRGEMRHSRASRTIASSWTQPHSSQSQVRDPTSRAGDLQAPGAGTVP